MAMSTIPILAPVSTGYRDAWSAIRAMPVLTGITVLIMFAFSLLDYLVPFRAEDNVAGGTLLAIVVSAVENFFLTPVMIAVHRFVILGEVAPRYVLAPSQPAFRVFFGWLLALSVLGLLMFPLFSNGLPAVLSLGVILIAMVLIIVISTRLVILFPAIAIEAPGAGAANAWADSKPHTSRIFLIFLLAVLPVGIGALFVTFPFALGSDGQGTLGIPALFIMAVVQTFAVILCVAIASRLYEALADRLLAVQLPNA
jgi:hypothetical protein